jgi:hypothetical protein
MQLRHIASAIVLTAAGFTTSCSGDSIPSFEDSLTAMDYAEAAMAENKLDHAEAGFEYVLANGDGNLHADCLQGIFSAQVRAGQEDRAEATFERIYTDQEDAFDGEQMLGLLDMAITSQMAELAELIMIYSYRNFEELAPKLLIPSAEIAKIRLKGAGDNDAVDQLGYVSASQPEEIKDENLEPQLKELEGFIRFLEDKHSQAAAEESAESPTE